MRSFKRSDLLISNVLYAAANGIEVYSMDERYTVNFGIFRTEPKDYIEIPFSTACLSVLTLADDSVLCLPIEKQNEAFSEFLQTPVNHESKVRQIERLRQAINQLKSFELSYLMYWTRKTYIYHGLGVKQFRKRTVLRDRFATQLDNNYQHPDWTSEIWLVNNTLINKTGSSWFVKALRAEAEFLQAYEEGVIDPNHYDPR